MLEILGGEFHPIFIEYAAITEEHKKEELAVRLYILVKKKQIDAFYDSPPMTMVKMG